MQRPTIQRPMRRRPAGTFDPFQGAVTLPGRRRAQQRRAQTSNRRRGMQRPSMQRTRSQRGKGGLARRGGRMLAVSGAGAAIAYFLDRKEGKQRRHQVRERASEMAGRRHEHHEHNGSSPEQSSDIPRVESPMGGPQSTPGSPGVSGTPGTMGG